MEQSDAGRVLRGILEQRRSVPDRLTDTELVRLMEDEQPPFPLPLEEIRRILRGISLEPSSPDGEKNTV